VRAAELGRFGGVGRDHDPGAAARPLRKLAATMDPPAAAHSLMAVQHEAALEAEQQMLAAGLGALEAAADERVETVALAPQRAARARGLRGDQPIVAEQSRDPAGGPMDRVALGHRRASGRRHQPPRLAGKPGGDQLLLQA
jgi:hypothetical protein